jgi:hypothetical protein
MFKEFEVMFAMISLGMESQEGEIFRIHPDQPWGPSSLLYNGYWLSFLGVKQLGHGVDHLPHLAWRLKKE